MLESNQWL